MKIYELLDKISGFAPFSLAEEWDNSGLLIGNGSNNATRVGVALDATPAAMEEAASLHCDVLITHHPLIFAPLKSINTKSLTGQAIEIAIKNNIAVIATHTNWDKAKEGVNYTLAELLGLQDIKPFLDIDGEPMFGTVGELIKSLKTASFLKLVKTKWNLSYISFHSSAEKDIRRVAICGGSGGDFWHNALQVNADVFISAEIKLHHRLNALNCGLALCEPEHHEMERASLPKLVRLLQESTGLNTVLLQTNVFSVVAHL